ncbi:subclass B1 metallo-beta-lactamase, long type [Fulvivirga lutea]|uniref:Metallo-beta-lactamase domain-containing protein n=1 Tax=Fulvivirga lutea TaxID=2810512 RepID=A0A974WK34_9BACT|nr:subclass B1 metallo-beta-lactamase, long type [Fulvivirga lutea]QSE98662.1 hypothetical protein JR347_06170 [Fulvivirga lutea]
MRPYLLIFFFLVSILSHGQEIAISDCLKIIRLSDSIYMHSCKNNNGLIYFKDGEAIIVSTPDSDHETQKLIDWVQSKYKIVAYVIDRWHPDAMGGLRQVQSNNIKSYSYEGTRFLAKEKNLPIPEFGFDNKLEIQIGNAKVVCHFLGEAHTSDGIVVWFPEERILFGGNEIRNLEGWVGNIADANLSEWSETVRKIKAEYGDAEIIVPGHGSPGGQKLIDYTIELYDFNKNQKSRFAYQVKDLIVLDIIDGFKFIATESKKVQKEVHYKNGLVFFYGKGQSIEIIADLYSYDLKKRTLYVPSGFLKIDSHNRSECFHFNELHMGLRDDEVEYTIVIKEVTEL